MSRRLVVLGFIALAFTSTGAHVAFKLTANASAPLSWDSAWLLRVLGQPWVYGAIACYLGSFGIWMSLLRRAPIGPAFAASHLEILGVLAASAWLFGERVSPLQALGVACIVAGVLCLAVGEDRLARQA